MWPNVCKSHLNTSIVLLYCAFWASLFYVSSHKIDSNRVKILQTCVVVCDCDVLIVYLRITLYVVRLGHHSSCIKCNVIIYKVPKRPTQKTVAKQGNRNFFVDSLA